MPAKRISDSGVSFIIEFEGFSSRSFWDSQQWSIGYGTKASGRGETITRAQAKIDLLKELAIPGRWLDRNINTDLNQNQIDALISFGYNLGTGALTRLKFDINGRRFSRVASRMLSFNHADGEVNAGLTRRRRAESKLFLKG